MDRAAGRNLLLIAILLAVDLVIAVLIRADRVTQIAGEDRRWLDYLAIFGLAVVAVTILLTIRAGRDMEGMWRRAVEADDRLQAVAATSHDWMWQATPDLIVTYCSAGVSEALGYEPDNVVGRSFLDLLHPDDAVAARMVRDESIRSATGWSDLELRWRRSDGSYVELQGSGIPILAEDGRVIGFRGTRRIAPSSTSPADAADARARVQGVLVERALEVALQPIIDVTRGRWVGVEALARFRDGRSPDVWLAEAHSVGFGLSLELLAAEVALEVQDVLPADISLCINVSPEVLVSPTFTASLTRGGHDLRRLILEITEHELVRDYDAINAALLPLRERGLRLSVDDTGAGYASFTHVLRLQPDIIKLDRSLLSGIHDDRARRALVTALVLLALELDAEIVAEGVETEAELFAILDLGIDLAQGYHLARPAREPSVWRSWATRDWKAAVQTPSAAATPALKR
jgi:PAS domain S-box-containing protein